MLWKKAELNTFQKYRQFSLSLSNTNHNDDLCALSSSPFLLMLLLDQINLQHPNKEMLLLLLLMVMVVWNINLQKRFQQKKKHIRNVQKTLFFVSIHYVVGWRWWRNFFFLFLPPVYVTSTRMKGKLRLIWISVESHSVKMMMMMIFFKAVVAWELFRKEN